MFKFLASVFNVGFIPFAPGTFGALVALAFWPLLKELSLNLYLLILIPFVFVSIFISNRALIEDKNSNNKTKQIKHNDPSWIVIDEFVGMLIALIPLVVYGFSWCKFIGAFILFRFFDITKLYPINKLEQLPTGFGIVLDDVLAGVYGALVLFILCKIF